MRLNATRLVLTLCWIAACGDDRASSESEGASSTTNMSEESSSSSGTESGSESGMESGTETETETETGEPSNLCETCTEDEMCIANADDSCDAMFGYTLECVPAVAACANGECDPECLQAVCGNENCVPPCGQVPGVEVWCSGASSNACDPMLQDCPEGEKCVPYSIFANGAWDANHCVPVTGDNMVGEVCTLESIGEGTDDCDENGWCYTFDGQTLMGTCYGFCEPDAICPDGQSCLIAGGDDALTLCMDDCVPHHPDNCTEDTVCAENGDGFICRLVDSPLLPDAPCEPFEWCSPGQWCVPANELNGCFGQSCCTDWCDTSMPDPCEPPESCEPAWPMGQAPEGSETAGLCKLP